MMAVLVLAPAWLAAVIDVQTRRIPNWLTAAAFLLAIGLAAWQDNLVPALLGAAACLLVGITIAALARGAFGGGDVKLMAYAGAATGIGGVPAFLFWMSVAGGLLALVVLLWSRRHDVGENDASVTRTTMPYGPAIAAGVTVTLLLG